MKNSKFTNVQKVLILKQGIDGVPVAEIRGWARNNLARYFNWKEKNAGLMPDDIRLLKALKKENGKYKGIVAGIVVELSQITYTGGNLNGASHARTGIL